MKHEIIDITSDHEEVHYFEDSDSGLKAIIAIHDTSLGMAMGGCRMWHYPNFEDALDDALRLSEGMSYKCAMAGLPIGGGKSVIIGDPAKHKSHDLLKAMASAVNTLGGRYIAAEDSGTSVRDIKIMQLYTPYVAGTKEKEGCLWPQNYGDPSPATAYGTLMGIQASVLHKFGRDSLKGLRVNIQGVGNVGFRIARHLVEAGANVYVYDAIASRQNEAVAELGVVALSKEDIIQKSADIFCPCALGGAINDVTVDQLDVAIVAGAANNQLSSEELGQKLQDKNVLYAPDFIINAGGIIDAGMGASNVQAVNDRVVGIASTLSKIYKRSEESGLPTSVIADVMAKEKISSANKERFLNTTDPHHQQLLNPKESFLACSK